MHRFGNTPEQDAKEFGAPVFVVVIDESHISFDASYYTKAMRRIRAGVTNTPSPNESIDLSAVTPGCECGELVHEGPHEQELWSLP